MYAALQDQYRALGQNVAQIRTDLMKEQLATFKSQLEDFARKHKVQFSLPALSEKKLVIFFLLEEFVLTVNIGCTE